MLGRGEGFLPIQNWPGCGNLTATVVTLPRKESIPKIDPLRANYMEVNLEEVSII